MADNVLGLLFEISADPSKAEAALGRYQTNVNQSLRAQAAEFDALAQTATTAFDRMAGAAQGAGGSMLRIFGQIADGIIRQIELQQLSVVETTKGEAAKSAIKIKAIKEVAVVRAIEEAAEGFASLAKLQFHQAALHFLSAAKFGVIAAVELAPAFSGIGGTPQVRAPGRGAAGLSAAGGTAEGEVTLAPGAASASRQAGPGGNVTVMVVGEPQAASWITKVINQGVLHQDLMLVASHTKRSAPAGR